MTTISSNSKAHAVEGKAAGWASVKSKLPHEEDSAGHSREGLSGTPRVLGELRSAERRNLVSKPAKRRTHGPGRRENTCRPRPRRKRRRCPGPPPRPLRTRSSAPAPPRKSRPEVPAASPASPAPGKLLGASRPFRRSHPGRRLLTRFRAASSLGPGRYVSAASRSPASPSFPASADAVGSAGSAASGLSGQQGPWVRPGRRSSSSCGSLADGAACPHGPAPTLPPAPSSRSSPPLVRRGRPVGVDAAHVSPACGHSLPLTGEPEAGAGPRPETPVLPLSGPPPPLLLLLPASEAAASCSLQEGSVERRPGPSGLPGRTSGDCAGRHVCTCTGSEAQGCACTTHLPALTHLHTRVQRCFPACTHVQRCQHAHPHTRAEVPARPPAQMCKGAALHATHAEVPARPHAHMCRGATLHAHTCRGASTPTCTHMQRCRHIHPHTRTQRCQHARRHTCAEVPPCMHTHAEVPTRPPAHACTEVQTCPHVQLLLVSCLLCPSPPTPRQLP